MTTATRTLTIGSHKVEISVTREIIRDRINLDGDASFGPARLNEVDEITFRAADGRVFRGPGIDSLSPIGGHNDRLTIKTPAARDAILGVLAEAIAEAEAPDVAEFRAARDAARAQASEERAAYHAHRAKMRNVMGY